VFLRGREAKVSEGSILSPRVREDRGGGVYGREEIPVGGLGKEVRGKGGQVDSRVSAKGGGDLLLPRGLLSKDEGRRGN